MLIGLKQLGPTLKLGVWSVHWQQLDEAGTRSLWQKGLLGKRRWILGMDINCWWSLPMSLRFRRKGKQVCRAIIQGTSVILFTAHFYMASGCLQVGKSPFLFFPVLNYFLSIFIHPSIYSFIHSTDTRASSLCHAWVALGLLRWTRWVQLLPTWSSHSTGGTTATVNSAISSQNRELWLGKCRVMSKPIMEGYDPGVSPGEVSMNKWHQIQDSKGKEELAKQRWMQIGPQKLCPINTLASFSL